MNIYTVRDNLKNTIAGKKKMLEEVRQARAENGYGPGDIAQDASLFATQEFLKVNIDELKAILADVEQCCEKATQDSWALNPDRSGGQFTQDEIYNTGRDGWIEP